MKNILFNIPFFLVGILLNWYLYITRTLYNFNFLYSFEAISKDPTLLLLPAPLSTNIFDIGIAGMFVVLMVLFTLERKENRKKYRKGKEYGSARWGGDADREIFIDREEKMTIKKIIPILLLTKVTFKKKMYYLQNLFKKPPIKNSNIILSETEYLTMNPRPKKWEAQRNKNILLFGGSGSGKTRNFIKPNIMQMHSSYVITDPKGTILNEVGQMLLDNGYKVKVLNLINFEKSMKYNPFEYIRKEEDIQTLVDTFIKNTNKEGKSGGDQFWEDAEALLYQAIIGLIYYEAPKEEHNFNSMKQFITAIETREDDPNFKCAVDLIFDDLEERCRKRNETHYALEMWKAFKQGAGKTVQNILISCQARLRVLSSSSLMDLTKEDELGLDMIGDEYTALFILTSDTNTTFNFMASILYTQMFNLLCYKADDVYGGRLPIHVRCLMDEFGNLGYIPNFQVLISTIRSREISATLVLQTQSQLKGVYKDHIGTIVGNCDTAIFLGGKEKETLKDIVESLGKETIDMYNTGNSKGTSESFSTNYQKLGRELMTMDELATMERGKCVVQITGTYPFLSNKYDITKHPMYKYHANSPDDKNWLDINKFITNFRKKKKYKDVSIKKFLRKKISKKKINVEVGRTQTEETLANYGGVTQ